MRAKVRYAETKEGKSLGAKGRWDKLRKIGKNKPSEGQEFIKMYKPPCDLSGRWVLGPPQKVKRAKSKE